MIERILHIKLPDILSTFSGWVLAILLGIVNFFASHKGIVNIVIFAVVIDAFWGIFVSIKQGKFVLSELGRMTISKLMVYGCVITLFIAVDKLLGGSMTLSATIIATLIVLVEAWSTLASMTIVYPNMVFLRVLRKVLKGEIARKLNIQECEVEQYLNKDANDKEDNNTLHGNGRGKSV